MTKTGSDHLKRRARDLARTTGRRYPDVLAELRRGRPTPTQVRTPSKELVRTCGDMVHPLDGGRCARPHGHQYTDRSGWMACATDPSYPAHIWNGYIAARTEAERAQHDAWWSSLTPEQREEEEARYWDEMAADAAEPVDPDFYADLDDEDDHRGDEDGEW
jgi:hypothetical protein